MIKILVLVKNTLRFRSISKALSEMDYESIAVPGAAEAFDMLDRTEIQLILADEDCGGTEFTEILREGGSIVPVIVMAENLSGHERRRIFRSGADGYMAIPLDLEEMKMRVRNLLWRCRVVDDAVLRFGNCRLIAASYTIETPDSDIELRQKEFLLLQKLLSYPGRIFTRPQLMDELWGFESDSDPRTVDTHIRRLRKKLKDVEDIRLQTVRGVGYRAVMPLRLRKAEKRKNTPSGG